MTEIEKVLAWAIGEVVRILQEQIESPGGERLAFEEFGAVRERLDTLVAVEAATRADERGVGS